MSSCFHTHLTSISPYRLIFVHTSSHIVAQSRNPGVLCVVTKPYCLLWGRDIVNQALNSELLSPRIIGFQACLAVLLLNTPSVLISILG